MLEPDEVMASPALMSIIVPGMLRRLKDPRQQFIFTFCILDGYPHKVAADILRVHETNVSRQIKRIRSKLVVYTKGYDIGQKYVKNGEK